VHNDVSPVAKGFIHGFFILLSILFIVPLISVVSVSFSDTKAIFDHGYSIFPQGFNTLAYQFLLKSKDVILRAYGVTFFITIAGCLLGLAVNALIAYPLSRRNFKYKTPVTVLLAISMFFNGGLVPTYIMNAQYLHGRDTLWVMIIPALCVPWFIILLRTFFYSIPYSLVESAMIDGAGEWRIFGAIILPLAKPALATIGLFLALNYWNEWFSPLLYISNNKLYPLQYLLYKYMADVQQMASMQLQGATTATLDYSKLPTESIRMAMCVLAAGPMLFVFPFFQKYFVKGLTVGALKG